MKSKDTFKNFIWCMAVTGALVVSTGLVALPVVAAEAGSTGESLAPAGEPAAASDGTGASGEADEAAPQPVPEQGSVQDSGAAPQPAADGGISVTKERQDGDGVKSDTSGTPNQQETTGASQAAGQQPPTKELDENTQKSDLKIVVEDDAKEISKKAAAQAELVDAPPIVPEGSAIDNNIFGVEGQYYVTIPKSMSFKKLANGDYETLQSSYYTVNSGMERGYKLSVKVSGINTDDTVQLVNDGKTVYRKAEVSTMACDIWQYRPDGTVLNVVESDATGYGKELVLDGPGKFNAKCRIKRYADDVLTAGTWSGSILFTVTCTPAPNAKNGQQTAEGQAAQNAAASSGTQTPAAGAASGDAAAASAQAGTPAAGAASGDAAAAAAQAAIPAAETGTPSGDGSAAASAQAGTPAAGTGTPSGDAAAASFQSAAVSQPAAGGNSVDESSANKVVSKDAGQPQQESLQQETGAMAPKSAEETPKDEAATEPEKDPAISEVPETADSGETGSSQEPAPEAIEGAE